jgi:hypothetical protein
MTAPNNSPVLRGLPPNVKGFDTITSHSWTNVSDWPEEGDPPVKKSKWILSPDDGEAMVLSGVVIKCSAGIVVGSSMLIQGVIDDAIPPITVAEYKSLPHFLSRSDKTSYLPIVDCGGQLRKPVIEMVFNFSQHLFLWSSAGLAGTPSQPKLDKLGIVKFRRMIARIANDSPYRMQDDSEAEIGASRYFAAIYSDPDFGV